MHNSRNFSDHQCTVQTTSVFSTKKSDRIESLSLLNRNALSIAVMASFDYVTDSHRDGNAVTSDEIRWTVRRTYRRKL